MNQKVTLWIAVVLIVLGLLALVFFPNMIYAVRDFGKSPDAGGNNGDICSPPEGTSIEEWTDHMGHHPDIYKDCLK